ncbi:hypothetical protein J4450_03285 [Candidatus Micrarchaeota archaeon]|nr:hypothetical protein [Candidatus Micrarchaeota archaeon]
MRLILFTVLLTFLFGCSLLQQTQEEKKQDVTNVKNRSLDLWKKSEPKIENKTPVEIPPPPVIENKTENTSVQGSLPNAQSYKLNLGESIVIDGNVYTFCDYAHRVATTTKISFCLGNSPALGFHALVNQEVPVGNYTVLVTKFVPKDNVIGLPEIPYLELTLSPKVN